MQNYVTREFVVDVSRQVAWDHLAKVAEWPSWAKHISRVDVSPAGALGLSSSGTLHLSNGIKSTFTMTEMDPVNKWTWVGPFLWLTVEYEHHFEEIDPNQTKLTWVVNGEGFGATIVGKLFAMIYNRNLDVAIPNLIEEMS